jgi:hypothetical protein
MGYSRNSGNGVDIEHLPISMILNDWETTLTCCLKTSLLKKARPSR